MATQEKLIKSLDHLKSLMNTNPTPDSSTVKKREKTVHCNIVVEAMCNSTVKIAPNYPNLLSHSIEILLEMCNDKESDIRMIADECLNRIIRSNIGYLGKVQIELHKQIKKNGADRIVRAALTRFAELAHVIRPHKGKLYVVNLIPCLIKIAERDEDILHDTLNNTLPKIMSTLGSFTTDNDIKNLLKVFLCNILNASAVIRRNAASCILTICLNCRKPHVFIPYVLNNLIDKIVPIQETHTSPMVLGILGTLKTILPHVKDAQSYKEIQGSFGVVKGTYEAPLVVDRLIQVYELCLHFISHSDHNIVNAALETLNVLLINAPIEVKEVLLSPNGISRCRIFSNDSSVKLKHRSLSQTSVATTMFSTDENLLTETDNLDSLKPDIEKWIDESKLSVMNITYAKTSEINAPKNISVSEKNSACNLKNDTTTIETNPCDYSNIVIGSMINLDIETETLSVRSESVVENMDKLVVSENSSEKSFQQICDDRSGAVSCGDVLYQDVDVGDFKSQTVPLIHCCRYIVRTHLLTGYPNNTIPDKTVKVSVKSLSLSCVASIVNLYPNIFLMYLDKNHTCCAKNAASSVLKQPIADILLFQEHTDPQLRGLISSVVGSFIKSVLIKSGGDYSTWIRCNCLMDNDETFELTKLLHVLKQGLEDESSICSRLSLAGISICLPEVAECNRSKTIIPILNSLPLLVHNPYWLVKVKLCEIISEINFMTVNYVTESNDFQTNILNNVLYKLLQDDDFRVRTSAAKTLQRLISSLYYPEDYATQNTVTAKAVTYKNELYNNLFKISSDPLEKSNVFLNNTVFPYTEIGKVKNDLQDLTLSRIVTHISRCLILSTSVHFTFGCAEALSLLLEEYPSTIYANGWSCTRNFSVTSEGSAILQRGISTSSENSPVHSNNFSSCTGLLRTCTCLLTTSTIGYDLNAHVTLLRITGNIFSGVAYKNLKDPEDFNPEAGVSPLWYMFTDAALSETSEQILNHVVKLLNIFAHILDETLPSVPQIKPSLANLPAAATNLSPIKRRKSDLGEKVKVLSPGKDKDDKKSDSAAKVSAMGFFANQPHYMKLYDLLKTAYSNYKTTLDSEASEKFLCFLRTTIQVLSQILEVGSIVELGRIAEEILHYLRATVGLKPTSTVACVQQLLKCLFGTNLATTSNDLHGECLATKDGEEDTSGFYYNVFHAPYNNITDFLNAVAQTTKVERDDASIVMGYLHRKDVKKRTGFKTLSKSSDKILASYIRLFEPMVIKSLKQYTVTSDVKLQAKVLQLLSQLVQLRVNYCLLDSEQIFIGFVLKQFEFIESGYIPLTEVLIPKIFNFLVHLSYGKQHSKSIISVPKIIQLCDGLMASGQSPVTHCIPALKPIVLDIFLARNQNNTGAEFKELETTREVLLSMLLRLVEYYKVMDLLSLIINESRYCNDNEERWIRWSKQIGDVLFPLLALSKIRLEGREAQLALQRLLMLLHRNVFNQIGDVVKIIFQEPPAPPVVVGGGLCNNWIGTITTLLLAISQTKEDLLLAKIIEQHVNISPKAIFNKISMTFDPLNVVSVTHSLSGVEPDVILARFIFRVVKICAGCCLGAAQTFPQNREHFIVEQLSTFLMYVLHMFQSGSHCKIAISAIRLVRECDDLDVDGINRTFLELAPFYPTLTCQWCYLLTLLNYNDREFWFRVVSSTSEHNLNLDIVKVGGVIVFSDYMCENYKENDQLMWLLHNHIDLLIRLSNEAPISELFGAIHRESDGSHLIVKSIRQKYSNASFDPTFGSKLLKCIENAHPMQSGAILLLLIPKMLSCRHLAISRQSANLANRKTELLLTLNSAEVKKQLGDEELAQILRVLRETQLFKKQETLTSLLNKLAMQHYDLAPLELDQKLRVDPDEIRSIVIDKSWYLAQVKMRCCQSSYSGPENAQLLSKLNFDDLIPILTCAGFNKLILNDCIELGCRIVQEGDGTVRTEPELLGAAVAALSEHVVYLRSLIPKPHQVFKATSREMTPSEQKYSFQLDQLFNDRKFSTLLNDITPSVCSYVKSLKHLPNLKIPDNHLENFALFAVICLEFLHGSQVDLDRHCSEQILQCISAILKQSNLCSILGLDSHNSWLCSSINSIQAISRRLFLKSFEPFPTVPNSGLAASMDNLETARSAHACDQLAILIAWFELLQNEDSFDDGSCLEYVRNVVVSLTRLPLVNSYVLTPPNAWAHGWSVDLTGPFSTVVPSTLPIEYLQEIDILEQLIFRITLLGWTSRQQFEEIWMCLLSVFNSTPDNDDSIPEELMAQATSQAVQAITALLLQSLLHPNPGNPNTSKLLHVTRDTAIPTMGIGVQKLKHVQNVLAIQCNSYTKRIKSDTKIRTVFNKTNVERNANAKNYSYGQLSVEYLWISTRTVEERTDNFACVEFTKRNDILTETGLDVNSCLQFLIDLYTQWIKSSARKIPIRLLHEVLKSTLIISDLFTEKSQFQWMLDLCLDLSKTHPTEDEILHQYLIIGLCKATAVLTPEFDTYETVKKLLVQSLKSAFIPSRIAALHGLLYLLQSCLLGNTVIGGHSEEMQLLYPISVDYVRMHLNSAQCTSIQNQEYHSVVWALTFFIMEHVRTNEKADAEYANLFLQNVTTLLTQTNVPIMFHNSLIKGLERLVVVKSLNEKSFQQIINVSLDKLKNVNLNSTITSLQLLLTCMYTDHEKQLEEAEKANGLVQNDPDNLVKAIEKLSAIFDRIRKGYPSEVKLLCSVLPNILNDFFPPSEILTKVIGELLSPQQPHPKLLSGVVFSVFERACAESQLPLLQDWVVFSLSNFTQSLPVGMSTWCLTCFFISASTNSWLRNIFPHVQSRIGRYVYEDRKILCIAGADFYNNLTTDSQKRTFIETFEKVERQPGLPFNDLVAVLTNL